jgi:hypothetical protein
MKSSAALFPIAFALGAITLAPWVSAQAQDSRQEGPIEIEKCQTISKPGSYKLVENLTARANTDCLVIITGFVTIDLAGFSISSGGGDTTGAGIITSGSPGQFHGITVRNGSISNFHDGVVFEAAAGPIIEGLSVTGFNSDRGSGIDALGAGGIVRGNTATNSLDGFDVSFATLTGNYAAGNTVGFVIGEGSTVIGNTARNNKNAGIFVVCPSNVTDNTATGSQFNLEVQVGTTGCNLTNNVAP